jgi:hypothetical protein
MPAKRDLTVEQIREQNRLRKRKQRAMSRDASRDTQQARPVTGHKKEARHVTPLQTSPVGGTTLAVETGKAVEAILAPFEARGYRHEPAFWAKMAARYPGVDLELEAMKLAEWLDTPKNAKALCSKARIDRWLKKTHAELQAAPAPTNGTTNGVYYQPNSLRHNRQPPSDDDRLPLRELLPIAKEEFQRTVAANRGLTLEQKRARLTARLTGHVPQGRTP